MQARIRAVADQQISVRALLHELPALERCLAQRLKHASRREDARRLVAVHADDDRYGGAGCRAPTPPELALREVERALRLERERPRVDEPLLWTAVPAAAEQETLTLRQFEELSFGIRRALIQQPNGSEP